MTFAITLWKFRSSSKLQLPKWELIWECGVHSLTLSYTFRSIKCGSQASLLAHTFASPCFGYEPKAKVMTLHMTFNYQTHNFIYKQINKYNVLSYIYIYILKLMNFEHWWGIFVPFVDIWNSIDTFLVQNSCNQIIIKFITFDN